MAVRNSECLKIIFLTLIAVGCAQYEPDFEYACDRSGMRMNITFDHPFRGLIYIKDYVKDPKCRLALQVPVLEATFNIPLMACDISSPWITVMVVVQHHPLIPTINDTVEPIACGFYRNSTDWSEVANEARRALNNYPDVISWLEFGLSPGVFDNNTLHNPNITSFMGFRVYNANRFNDILVTECIAHNEAFLAPNTSIHQMTQPIGCFSDATDALSLFNVSKSDQGVITGAYAEFNPLNIPHPNNSSITCSAVLCYDKCECPQNGTAKGYQVIATKRLWSRRSKRSILDESSTSNYGNTKIGNSLMRSTIKALTDRLMKSQMQTRVGRDAGFTKRSIELDEVTTATSATSTATPTATHDFRSDNRLFTRVPTTDSNIQLQLNIPRIRTQNFDSKKIPADFSMFLPERELEKFKTQEDILTESSHDTIVVDPDSVTLVPEDDLEEMLHLFDETIEDARNNDAILKHSNEDLQQTELTKISEEIISTLPVTTETKELEPEVIDEIIDSDKQDQDDCIPMEIFTTVTISLSLAVVCLIVISCGIFLHMSREKKKRVIDNFLLYSFY